MEPMNCVVQFTGDSLEVWNGEQFQTVDQANLAALFGLSPEKVNIHMLYAGGGSFGRRACKDSDYVKEAASIVKAAGTRAPVKMVWLREDDMKGGYYRPQFHHAMEAALNADGSIRAWRHRLVGQSIAKGSPFEGFMIKDGVDGLSVERRGDAALRHPQPAGGTAYAQRHHRADTVVGARWARRIRLTPPKPSSTSWPLNRNRIR